MNIGDKVVRKSYGKDVIFKIIDLKTKNGKDCIVLKGISLRIIADADADDLIKVEDYSTSAQEKILNKRVNNAIKKAISYRNDFRGGKEIRTSKEKNELMFGRPGRILHIDGDSEYMETCLKVYKQLSLDAVGVTIAEKDQPDKVVSIVKDVKPDIVVLTGHDSVVKKPDDYLDLKNYRNSKYYLESVKNLRNYNSSYDELVIFAGACQSCYERILDVGANFASSPNRVLIHCLDPVFVCEKIAYTKVDKMVPIKDVIENTITGIKGVGGLQTRGKYREGYPKSVYV